MKRRFERQFLNSFCLKSNFVREDRKRQETKLSTVGELESKTPKKIIIRSRPLSAESSDGKDFGNGSVESRNKTTQSLVRSRLSKFDQPIERSRSLSPSPSAPAVDNSLSSLESSTERLIFGISPKSNSLSRY